MTRLRRLVVAAFVLLPLAGCHSAMVDATLTNATTAPLRLLELDYPSASFGVQTLAPGADFRYRFKILGSGPLRLSYVDSNGQQHAFTGPSLHEAQEGPIHITIRAAEVDWANHLHE